ncbi:MAG: apolipoprotein N-acyltransferase [Rhodobacter sp.]|nr:apolipoprotein N-acyltransferase [Rhodobacter sp.]
MADTRRPYLPSEKVLRRPRRAALVAGLFAGLGQAPVGLPWATLIGLGVVFFLFRQTKTVRAAGWLGWVFGFGYFAATMFWIVEPFLVDIARHGWMAPFALFGLAGGLAIFWGAAMAAARWLAPRGWAAALGWAVCLSLAEFARSYVLTGFPWALIGHVWVGWAPMQLAAFAGPLGLTFLTLLLASFAVLTFPRRKLFVTAVLLPFAVVYGLSSLAGAKPVALSESGFMVRLVQPNAPQHLKWHPDHAREFFARQVEMTAASAPVRPDLIIWPETAVPTILSRAGPAFEQIAEAADGTPVVLGIQRLDSARAYNSLVHIDATGAVAAVYDKYHLVPFGEYVPLAWAMSYTPLASFVDEHGFGYSAGPGARLVDLGELGKVLPLICYEAIFPQDVNAAPTRPDWLLQITNDAWFGRIAGPYQHLAQARLRAVEQGLPLVRVANTGVSAVIDARGNVTARLELGQTGFLDAALPVALPRTIYARTGDWASILVLFTLLLLLFGLRLRFRH